MGNKYGKILTKPTAQSAPIPGRETEMAKNNAGGYSFVLDKWKMLERFLVLGTEGGTYYVNEDKLTKGAVKSLEACIAEDSAKVAAMIMDVSFNGKAFKNDPAELALASLIAKGGQARQHGWAIMSNVVRTGRTLLEFSQLLDTLGVKWPMSRRNAFAHWYTSKKANDIAYQVIKYQSAGKWTHRDILRLCHPTPDNETQNLYRYIVGKDYEIDKCPPIVAGWELMKSALSIEAAVNVINSFGLTWEFVPGQWQGEKKIWEALLPNLPYTALIRNLGRMTSYKMLEGINDNVKFIRDKLTNRDGLRKARVHPMQALIAWRAYMQGGMNRAFQRDNALTWSPNNTIVAALEDAFYLAFETVVPSNKDMMLGIDVSGSMSSNIMNLPITCSEAATVLAMVQLRTEKNSIALGFDRGIRDMGLTKNDNFASAFRKLSNVNGGGTDCAMPMVHALDNGMNFDQFVVLTDSETWAGKIHPVKAIEKYREKTGINAKLVVVGMTSTGFTIADPKDAGMLDVVGFDTSVPGVISKFAQGL